MKRKTTYIWMSTIVTLSVALFTIIYFLNLGTKVRAWTPNLTDGQPAFLQAIYGDFDNPLNKPMDVAKIGDYIYVSDTGNNQIQVFDLSGNPVNKFGEYGKKPGQFNFPYGITGDKDGNVYVADMNNGRISIFNSKGEFITNFVEQSTLDPYIKSPGAIRIYDEKLYVPDIKTNKVIVYDLNGNFILEIGEPGNQEGQFIAPNAVALDKDGNIYVSDSGNNRVQVFDEKGNYVRQVNGSDDGEGAATYINPRGIVVNSSGTLFITVKNAHTVYAYDKAGKEMFFFGGLGAENDKLYFPNGMMIDERNTIYITDTKNERVSIFK